jgi:hypothetical protein
MLLTENDVNYYVQAQQDGQIFLASNNSKVPNSMIATVAKNSEILTLVIASAKRAIMCVRK